MTIDKTSINSEEFRVEECDHEYDHNGECLKCDEPIIMNENKECCEGGPMTAGCYHDHCTGPKEKNT